MNGPVHRLLLEASTATANHTSQPHRTVAAREVSQLALGDIVGDDQAEAHLRMAVRDCVLAMALFQEQAVIAEVAAATQALVRAARLQIQHRGVTASPRRYWLEGDAA